jgi:hypothetical protein
LVQVATGTFMISPIDQEYKLTKLIKQGKATMNADFIQLAGWIDQAYGVTTMNIIYSKIDNNTRPRLNIIFEKSRDQELFMNKFGFDPLKQNEIACQFEMDSVNHKYDTHDILIIISAFEPVAKIETHWSVPKDKIQSLQLELNMKDLWQVHSNTFDAPTFFFNTVEQAEQYSKNGTKEILSKKCFELMKKYDEFDYFKENEFSIQLDSKENLENYYKGSWFNYDRR